MEPLPKNETTIKLNPVGVREKARLPCRSLANYKDMKK